MYDLQRLQSMEVNMMECIHEACMKLGIHYVILSGTLLGAVRHKGFIPWDDDIDVGMLRKDYERFLKEGHEYLPKNLFIQHYSTDPETSCPFIKVMDVNTVFLEPGTEDEKAHHGIFIDVFPFDRVPSSQFRLNIEYKRKCLFQKILNCYSVSIINTFPTEFKRKMGFLIRRCLTACCPIHSFIEMEDRRRKRLDRRSGDCYLLNQYVWNGTVTKQELFDATLYPFEQYEFYGPKNYDSVLTKYYGPNYMELPPVEKRRTHRPLKVIFDLNESEDAVQ